MKGKLRAVGLMLVLFLSLLVVQPAEARITKEMKQQAMTEVTKGLESSDPQVKAHAILSAAVLNDRKLNKELLPYLDNTNREIRQAAIAALAANGDRKALAAFDTELAKAGSGRFVLLTNMMPLIPEKQQLKILGKLIGSKKDNKGRNAAIRYVSEYGQGKVYRLLSNVSKARSKAEREPILRALYANPRPESFDIASKLIKNKRDADARLAGLKLAKLTRDKRFDGLAKTALKDKDTKVSDLALTYLSEAGSPDAADFMLDKLAATSNTAEQEELIEKLLKLKVKLSYDKVNKVMGKAPKDGELAMAFHRLLGATQDKKAVETLLKLESSTLIKERQLGVAGLGYTKDKKALDVLKRTVFDGNQSIRTASITGLGVIAHADSVKVLADALKKSKDVAIRRSVVSSLADVGDASAAKELLFLTRDRDRQIKLDALRGIAKAGDKANAGIVEVLVRDKDKELSWKATMALLRIDKARVDRQLDRALQRPPENYMDTVTELPKELRDQLLVKLLNHTDKRRREEALDTVIYMGFEGQEILRRATRKSFPADVRERAIDELSRVGSPKDVALFKRMAQTGSREEKIFAISWLAARSDKDTALFFETLMNGAKADPGVRLLAMYGWLRASK